MSNRPRKTPQAEIDVTSIWSYVAADSIKAADTLIGRIERYDLAKDLRSFPVAYIIFYISVPDGVEVVRVMNGRQDIDADDIN
jgi:toxin ParE1/3/4